MEAMSAVQAISEDYMNLIRRFPLMPIRKKIQLKQAANLVDELSDRLSALSRDERAYFDVLCDLIKHYESEQFKPDAVTPAEALKYLMEINNLTLNDLVPVVHHKSHLSAFLHGKRSLSKANALRLAERFKVSPALFLRI
jgi:HTH-type transcriptional regulator/antitoxin HigA